MPLLKCREEETEQPVEEQNERIPASLTLKSTVSWALWSSYGTEDETLQQADEGGLALTIFHSITKSRNSSTTNN
jgi:hypothetical protein